MRRLMLAEFAAVAALALLASLGFERVFAGNGLVVPLVGAALIPTAIAVVGMYRNASAVATLLWSMVGFVVYTTYAALGDTAPNVVPTVTTLRELSRGLTSGWADLLTVSLPAPEEPRLRVVVIALAWAAAAIGGEFAHRSRSTAAPVLPAIGVYVAALAYAASLPRGTLLLPVTFAAVLLFVMLVHANRWAVLEPAGLRRAAVDGDDDIPTRNRVLSVDTSANRWVALGVPVIAVALLVAAVVTLQLPERRTDFDPRSLRNQRVDVDAAANPLDGLKAELKPLTGDPVVRFQVETAGFSDAVAVPRIRLTVLDRFDGASWSSSGAFSRAGDVLPLGPSVDVATQRVSQTITVGSLADGPWLPAAERPVELRATSGRLGLAVDATTGVVISTEPLTDLAYTVVSDVQQPTAEQLGALTIEDLPKGTELTAVPGMPADLRQIGLDLVRGAVTPYERLMALQRSLSEGYTYNEDVASGASYGRLQQFLTRDGGGYAEQFAGAFATFSRAMGYPTRLAYGYLTTRTDGTTGELRPLTDITSREAHVWPEVELAPGLWVPFEPTPERIPAPLEAPDVEQAGGSEQGGIVAPGQAAPPNAASNPDIERPEPARDRLSTPLLAALTLLLAIVMLLVGLVVLKRLRRARRRKGASSTEQVLGAWAVVTDRLLEVGVAVDRSMTAKEVVETSTPQLSARAADRLGAMVPHVTFALYSPVAPGHEVAAAMWEHADAFHREALEGKEWYRGPVALLNPRPLLLNVHR